jgi:DNA-binding CsgD family transcriptional regulator
MSFGEAFRSLARQLKETVPFDAWCGLTLDPSTLLATGGVHENGLTPTAIRRLLEIEYGGDDVCGFAALAKARLPAGALRATVSELEKSSRYRDVLTPSGYSDELRLVLRAGDSAWGAMVFFRGKGALPFDTKDVVAAAACSVTGAEALRTALLAQSATALDRLADRALLVVDAATQIESATPEARRLLGELVEEGPPDPERVPHTVQALAHESRRGKLSRVRARTKSGEWVTLHAAALDGGRVAVFVEPSRPLEIAGLLLKAYGLSNREGELMRLVLHGLDTQQIAVILDISPYTVQDHLKSIFDKAGVSSRKELVERIFFTHYLPRLEQGVGPDGWFA